MTHSHWTICAYKKRVPLPDGVGVQRDEFVDVAVDANSEEEALRKAKETIDRPFYDVVKVFVCEVDHELQQELQLEQVAIQKTMLKELLGMKNR